MNITEKEWVKMLRKTKAKPHAKEIANFFERRGIVNQSTLQNAPILGHLWGHDIYSLVDELNMLFAADLVDESELEAEIVSALGDPAEEE